ncbi:ethanolamine ammonia-lyase subunit EutB [Nocardia africana]|uniref:Ethanolamine ammonia-lyase subunit EutB n=1 Tax=Nocardia africana TaxID=134964 RepID=A0ABW6NM40_9NOCA
MTNSLQPLCNPVALSVSNHLCCRNVTRSRSGPSRGGDELADSAATSDAEGAAEQWALAEVPLNRFLREILVPDEDDEVTDLHDHVAFQALSHLTDEGMRDWLMRDIGPRRRRRRSAGDIRHVPWPRIGSYCGADDF